MPRSSNRQAPCVPPHVRAQSDGLPSLACRGEGGDAAAGGRGQGTNRPEGGVGAAIVESLGWGEIFDCELQEDKEESAKPTTIKVCLEHTVRHHVTRHSCRTISLDQFS